VSLLAPTVRSGAQCANANRASTAMVAKPSSKGGLISPKATCAYAMETGCARCRQATQPQLAIQSWSSTVPARRGRCEVQSSVRTSHRRARRQTPTFSFLTRQVCRRAAGPAPSSPRAPCRSDAGRAETCCGTNGDKWSHGGVYANRAGKKIVEQWTRGENEGHAHKAHGAVIS
jgi:hypothetical protein